MNIQHLKQRVAESAMKMVLKLTEEDTLSRAKRVALENDVSIEIALQAVTHRQDLALRALELWKS